MRKAVTVVEWILLLVLGIYIATLVVPYSDMYHFSRDFKQAKKEGTFYAVSSDSQPYYDNKLRVDGIIYRGGQLSVYMTGTGSGPYGKLPGTIQVETDSGQKLQYSGGGSSSSVLQTRGYFLFKDVPAHIQSLTIRNHEPSYGETFTFRISLEGSGRHDE